ncbi:pyridoxamine 5'-phosphate oxidase family protein [Nonomuraea jiangxiensis]|uniref:Pyridoxamine 5'-phosphate oxidase n=1 Tax=Nonomuraea jiangxiensis TaxID=633440 RepID=A0A1G8BPU3_9ACTN|nr:pyridoxamine 5'-phosphate oxidase family protein [Nonomuraea jiangxiensis]SDH35171.1 Pyridoxamine 5'-phosphate oxidase [Nonomuraea jiangxiensis]
MTDADLDAHARSLMDANLYAVVGTVDADGIPWTSPVYFATADYAEIFWVSGRDLDRGIEIYPGEPSRGGAALPRPEQVARKRRAQPCLPRRRHHTPERRRRHIPVPTIGPCR